MSEQPARRFRDEKIEPVYRRWICDKDGCDGEMRSTGQGFTQLTTTWSHECTKCHRREGASAQYPRIAYLPLEAIEPK
jgi:hypothetical protein